MLNRGVGVKALRSVAKVQCEVDGTGVLPLGEEHLGIPPRSCPLESMLCDVSCHLS